jgi:hypothetical protein
MIEHSQGTNLTIRGYEETISEFIIPAATRSLAHDREHQRGNDDAGIEQESPRIFRIYNKRFDFPCLDTLMCQNAASANSRLVQELEHNEKLIFDYTSSLLLNFSSDQLSPQHSSHRTICVFNYGLHLHEESSWMVRPMARALYEAARAGWRRMHVLPDRSEDVYMFRETSSQAFSFTRGESVSQ